MKAKSLWNRDDVQFPRLISEIMAVGVSEKMEKQLAIEMNVEPEQVRELFERAQDAWEKHKKALREGKKI
jgi:hypothetical protein